MIVKTAESQLELLSTPESLNVVETLIEDLRNEYKINEDSYGNMLVAVTEAVNNAIFHGNKADPQKKVNITLNVNQDKVCFLISDEGLGFDYYNLPDPTAPENVDKPNGRGVFLMKNLTDQLIFSERGRVVEMHFKMN